MKDRFLVYLSRHLQVLFDSLGRLWKTPFASAMTILVIAVALALPMVLHKVVSGLQEVLSDWEGRSEISLFLHPGSEGNAVDPVAVGQQLLENPVIEDVRYVSPEEGLTELANLPGMEAAVSALPENPLPPLLVVVPATGLSVDETESLAEELGRMDVVDSAIFDQRWLHRLSAIVELVGRGVAALAVLVGVGVVLVISNTVRLGISNRAAEIEIIDQVGGTRAFIRRPFLYTGALQCFLGAATGWLLANVVLGLLSGPVGRLAALYHGTFHLGWVDPSTGCIVVGVTVLLGWSAARVTVDQYFWNLRPR